MGPAGRACRRVAALLVGVALLAAAPGGLRWTGSTAAATHVGPVLVEDVAPGDGERTHGAVAVMASLLVVDELAEVVVDNRTPHALELDVVLHAVEPSTTDGAPVVAAPLGADQQATHLSASSVVLRPDRRARVPVRLPDGTDVAAVRLDGDGLAAPLDVLLLRAAKEVDVAVELRLDGEVGVAVSASRWAAVRLATRVHATPGRTADVDHGALVVAPGAARVVRRDLPATAVGRVTVSAAATVVTGDGDGDSATAELEVTHVGLLAVLAAVVLAGSAVAVWRVGRSLRRQGAVTDLS